MKFCMSLIGLPHTECLISPQIIIMMKPLSLLAAAILCVSTVMATPNVPQNLKPLKVKNAANLEQMRGEIPYAAPLRAQEETSIPDDAVEMYAFQVFGYGWITSGFVQFPSYDPAGRTFLYDYGYYDGANTFRSGTFVGDTYYAFIANSYAGGAFLEPVGLATIDLETGDWWCIADYSQTVPWNEMFYEMSYDPKTELIYAIQTEYDSETGLATNRTKLWTIDPFDEEELYEPMHVATIDEYLWTMSVDNGVIYGIVQDYSTEETDLYGNPLPKSIHLVTIDTETITEEGTCTVVKGATIDGGNTVIDWAQTMEFDHTTHNLWWAGQPVEGDGWLCKINITDGTLTEKQKLPEFSQYVALGIPYQIVPDNAPSYVKSLSVKAGAEGAITATLSWENPSTSYSLAELTELSGVKIYRGETLIADLTSTEIGATQTFTDNEVTKGIHTYKIVPYNTAGDGINKERTIYVGADIPATVSNIVIDTDGQKATISWTAPAIGANGGYIDINDLKYDVVRMPENLTIATDITATSVTDEVDEYKGYYYNITVKNAEGSSEVATSTTIPYGPSMPIPYTNDFSSLEVFGQLTVIDANGDNNTWSYLDWISAAEYYYNENAADDYLVTPPFDVVAGNEYEVKFDYQTSNWTGCIEKLCVLVGNKPKTDAFTKTIHDLPELLPANGGIWIPQTVTFTADETGTIHVAFKVYSDADMGSLDIRNIVVRHVSATDLAANEVFGSDLAYVNNPIKHSVVVTNTGNATVTNGIVKLVDDYNTVLGQANIGEIAAQETLTINVEWVPVSEGDINIYGVVELEGDTYTGDNKTATPAQVTVYSADSDKWFSIGVSDNVGYRPIYLSYNYSEMQTLYYGKDITVDGKYFTGLQYRYNKPFDMIGLEEIPITIYIMNTEDNKLDSLYTIGEEYLVYDGIVDLVQDNDVNYMTIKFDRAFEYTGNNIIIKMVSNKEYAIPDVEWHIIDESFLNLDCRSYCAFGENAELAHEAAYDNYYIPYVRLSYDTDNAINGVNAQSELTATKCGNAVYFNMTCNTVDVYSVTGERLFSTLDTDKVDLSQFNNGVFIIKAVSGNNTTVLKVVK